MYYAYMIQSEKTRRHYYGHTSDVRERLYEHNTGQSPYTQGKGPWILVGFVACNTRAKAVRIELKLKGMKNPSRATYWLQKHGVVF